MINTHTREKLEYRLEENIRRYSKAKLRLQQIKDDTIAKIRETQVTGLDTVGILNEMSSDIDVCESDMNFCKKDFEEAKAEYIELINKLKLDWIL